MIRIPTVVVGAGHAGLAVSKLLTDRHIEHVVLERGEVANTWRRERWDSLRLLTPNWQTRLPGFAYSGNDPDGFMTMPEVVGFIDAYATAVKAPVETGVAVRWLRRNGDRYEIAADGRRWDAASVVLATGGFNLPKLPALAADLPPGIESVTGIDYKRPDQLPEGGVLVVGASATGIQVANELQRSGRQVTLAVGEHVRLPRLYRGRDIQWWMEQIGRLDERYDQVDDLVRARHVPSPQLVGTPDRSTLDLNALTAQGVRLVGKLSAIQDGKAYFSGSLRNVCSLADLKMRRLLDEIDAWIDEQGLAGEVGEPERFPATEVENDPALSIYLSSEISSVFWATGYRADYSWLDIDVLDRKGELRHDGGVVADSPGLYRIGLNFLRRRKSSFIHGAEDDAIDLTEHLVSYLEVFHGMRAAG
ncbi:MAG TPA: NAD(P)-binding domain-containing protein [Acidimicrobiia bacterium]|jgi:putative flavoprotein involved in K+ transport|nr:NAD(P)-binding domain-containing protein [Acidimicrobiia bacterium]